MSGLLPEAHADDVKQVEGRRQGEEPGERPGQGELDLPQDHSDIINVTMAHLTERLDATDPGLSSLRVLCQLICMML